MKQLFQNAKEATIEVVDLPEPAVGPGQIRVRNRCSAVSPGTERSTVSAARDSYLKTARNRPDLVRQVMDVVRREGVAAAYRKVQTKLAEPKALGYSSAGVVDAIGPGAGDYFRVGDRVACAGQGFASHAEVVTIPVALAAKIPDNVSFESASFTTIGAIALHGVRLAAPTLGERFAVIGLGIVGQFAVQLLRSNGCRVAAYDLDPRLVEVAKGHGAEIGVAGGTDDQVLSALAWSEGLGVDGVIVTAAASNDGPMLAAAGMCRDRARVVVVGSVPFGLPREIAFAKELELRISRSYGPGRYDAAFEEKGVDWPVGYVRWTETRNLEAILQLLAEQKLDIESMITHRFPIAKAASAYDELTGSGPRPLGMVLDYPATLPPKAVAFHPVAPAAHRGTLGVGFIGAGAFARGTLIPAFQHAEGTLLRRVATAHGLSAVDAQRRYGFAEAGTDVEAVLSDPQVHVVAIATRHDLHAEMVVKALQSGRHVFVEKPLALTPEQLDRVVTAAKAAKTSLMVGFNRRFAPQSVAAREAVAGLGPAMITIRVNAGALKPGHWANDREIGGGRMIGEGCHFVDLMSFLAGDSEITSVYARAPRSRGTPEDFAVTLGFADGSTGQLLYVSRGNSGLAKEHIEVHAGGVSAVIDDFRETTVYRGAQKRTVTGGGKGHEAEVAAFIRSIREGKPSPTPLKVLDAVTRATFAVHEELSR